MEKREKIGEGRGRQKAGEKVARGSWKEDKVERKWEKIKVVHGTVDHTPTTVQWNPSLGHLFFPQEQFLHVISTLEIRTPH